MWLFRFSEESCVSEFLKRHPFAEPVISSTKTDFHDRILYNMAFKDPQTEKELALYVEGQPSQTSEGTMPRMSGFSCKDIGLEALVREESKTIIKGGNAGFTVSIWNLSSKPLRIATTVSLPKGTKLNASTKNNFSITISPANVKNLYYEFTWPVDCQLPDFTTFSTVPATIFLKVEDFNHPFFVTAGFNKI